MLRFTSLLPEISHPRVQLPRRDSDVSVVTEHCLATEGEMRWRWEPTPRQASTGALRMWVFPLACPCVTPKRWCGVFPLPIGRSVAMRTISSTEPTSPVSSEACSHFCLQSDFPLGGMEPAKLLGGFASQNQGRRKVSVLLAKRWSLPLAAPCLEES